MEEILASIRRIIAEDDSAKVAPQSPQSPQSPEASRAPAPAARSAAPFVAPSEPFLPELEPPADLGSIDGESVDDQSSDIFDLTESMAAPAPEPELPVASAMPDPSSVPEPQFFVQEDNSEAIALEMAEISALEARNEEHAFDGGEHHAPSRAQDHIHEHAHDYAQERGGERQLLSSETSAAVDSAFNALAQTVLVQNARTLEDLVREMLRPMLKAWLDDNLPGMVERLVRAEIERVSRGR
jgi:cell pole-organizing protein PopZ